MFPSEEEKRFVEGVKKKVADAIRNCLVGLDYDLKFAGSTELGTFISGDYDVDAFVVTRKKTEAFNKVSKCFEGAMKKGELDIWHISQDGVETDIVFMNPDEPKTQTLEHTDHYKKVLDEDDIREIIKAKILMKNRGCYSAELGGITGVALTELISEFGNLEKACEVLEKDRDFHLADPTKPERNLLASVTPTRWECVKKACKEYRESGKLPTEKYTEETFKSEKIKQGFKVLELPRQDDVAIDFSRGLSACRTCGNELQNLERIEKPECDAFVKSKTLIAFKTESALSPKIERRISLALPKEAIEKFREEHPEATEKDGFVVVEVPRKVTEPKDWMEKCIRDKFRFDREVEYNFKR